MIPLASQSLANKALIVGKLLIRHDPHDVITIVDRLIGKNARNAACSLLQLDDGIGTMLHRPNPRADPIVKQIAETHFRDNGHEPRRKPAPVNMALPVMRKGQHGDLGFAVTMKRAGDVFDLDREQRAAFDLANVELPVFRWTDKAGIPASHPDVPAVDPHYKWRAHVLDTVVAGLAINEPTWLTGDTATGKSTAYEQACAVLNWPMLRLNLDCDISRMELIGRDILSNGSSRFVDGPVPAAIGGPCVLVLDEIDFARSEVLYVIQRALEQRGVLIPEDGNRLVQPHPWSRIGATSNTKGQGDERRAYQGARILSLAILDRLRKSAEVDYLDWQSESALLRDRFPILRQSVADALARFAQEVRKAFRGDEIAITCSLRSLDSACQYMTLTGDTSSRAVRTALTASLVAKATSDDAARLNEIMQRVIA